MFTATFPFRSPGPVCTLSQHLCCVVHSRAVSRPDSARSLSREVGAALEPRPELKQEGLSVLLAVSPSCLQHLQWSHPLPVALAF